MKTVGFQTKLCKPRHPFTKGKVERLIRFVKENYLVDRVFANITDLNWQALEWCNRQNSIYHRAVSGVPQQIHPSLCGEHLKELPKTDAVRSYLCPVRKISFDGFVNYEGRRFDRTTCRLRIRVDRETSFYRFDVHISVCNDGGFSAE